jgi:glycyl-tRNA synthetase
VDDSGASIGKKYARNDELGTPFGCTVDFACELHLERANPFIHTDPVLAIKNGTITLRERDSTAQLIGSIEDVIETVEHLVKGTINWQDASSKLEEYNGVQDVE